MNNSPSRVIPDYMHSFFVELNNLFDNPKISYRKNIFLCYQLSRFFTKNYSFFMRTKITFFGRYRICDFKSFIINLRNVLSFKFIIFVFAFFLGLIHFPAEIFQRMLFFRLKELTILQKSLDKMENNIFLFATNGLDNLYFLLMVLNKPINTKYFAITYSWDNISSKFILSKKLDHVALWNGVQQEELKEIYGSELIESTVIGSKMADKSHEVYSKLKTNTKNFADSETLILLGLFNKSNEFEEVLRINELIQTSNIFWYKKIVYRPHPLSKSNLKQINYDLASQLEIQVNRDKNLNLSNYGGIICLPTSMIFEVILSGRPAILYAPKHPKYRADPYNMLKYKHFEVIRNLNPLPIVTEFNDLKVALIKPFPIQKKLESEQMHRIFPKFSTNYDSRISLILENL